MSKMQLYNEPLKLHYIYRLGEIIDFTDGNHFTDGTISTPDFSNPEHLVLENAKRGYILKNDPNYVIYNDQNKKYTTLLNRLFFGFKVKINNQFFTFDSREHANNAVVEYIKLNSYKAKE